MRRKKEERKRFFCVETSLHALELPLTKKTRKFVEFKKKKNEGGMGGTLRSFIRAYRYFFFTFLLVMSLLKGKNFPVQL